MSVTDLGSLLLSFLVYFDVCGLSIKYALLNCLCLYFLENMDLSIIT